ncbi:MAG: hypothetical protein ACI4XF_04765 [Oscillospiraceae bacterium]
MEQRIYDRLTDIFVFLRYCYGHDTVSEERQNDLSVKIGELKALRQYISENPADRERDILLYCIDELSMLLGENNRQKIYDFCDAVHNIAELFYKDTWKYGDYWNMMLKPFCRKYGSCYFSEIKHYFMK